MGGGPSLDWLAGGEHCGTVGDLLADATRAKHDVVIVDRTGRPQALATTLHRAEHGRRLQVVTLDGTMAVEMEYSSRVICRMRFAGRAVRVTADHQRLRVERHGNDQVLRLQHVLVGRAVAALRCIPSAMP